MLKVFGKKLCSACQEKKAELEAQGIEYYYFGALYQQLRGGLEN